MSLCLYIHAIYAYLVCVCVCVCTMCSAVSDSLHPYGLQPAGWSGLPFPSPDLPDSGIKPVSLVSSTLTGRFFTTGPHGKPTIFSLVGRIVSVLLEVRARAFSLNSHIYFKKTERKKKSYFYSHISLFRFFISS